MARPRRKRRSWFYQTLAITALLVICSVGAVTVAYLMATIDTLPDIEELSNYDPPQSTFVYDSRGAAGGAMLAEFSKERRYVLSYQQMPDRLVKAFIAIEDRRFLEHFGVDPVGVLRAAVSNYQSGGRPQGASTITMQVPGNVAGVVDRTEISYNRKFKEALMALQIERRYSKEQILEFYLNQIFLGHGAYGVEAAAKTYFGKTVQQLTLAECATIAGIPKSPSSANPITSIQKATARRDVVLNAMLENGFISQSQYLDAKKEPMETRTYRRQIEPYKAPYFVDYLEDSMLADPDYVPQRDGAKVDPKSYLYTGGFQVVSTLDFELQRIAEEVVSQHVREIEKAWHEGKKTELDREEFHGSAKVDQERLATILSLNDETIEVRLEGSPRANKGVLERPKYSPFYDTDSILKVGELIDVRIQSIDDDTGAFKGKLLPENKLKGSMVVLQASNPGAGRVLAMVGGEDYYDHTDLQRQYNYATMGGRQPGSGIKPLFYAAAIEKGFTPNRMFLNSPFSIGDYKGQNYDHNHEGRMMTIQEGLERSQNVMMLRVIQEMGVNTGVDMVKRFDFAWPKESWDIPRGQASVCLGTFDVTPLEIASAYLAIVNNGIEVRPYAVDRLATPDGKVVYEHKPKFRKIVSPQDAYMLNSMMRGVFGSRGTAYYGAGQYWAGREDLPQMGGKTGTTDNCNDIWFNGITPDLIVSVCVGFDPPRSLGFKMSGGTLATPIFKDFIERALITRDTWKMKFDTPEGLVVKDICLRSGLIAGEYCKSGDPGNSYHTEMVFKAGEAPRGVCSGAHE